MPDRDNHIVIAGGGSIDCVAAIVLTWCGIPFTLLKAGTKVFDDPRAGTIHPPTMVLMRLSPSCVKMGTAAILRCR